MNINTTWLKLLITPRETFNYYSSQRDNSELDKLLIDYCLKFGQIWTHQDEQSGAVIQNVQPSEQYDNSSNYFSSTYPLSIHQDYFFCESPPSLTFIWCINNAERASTVLVDLHQSFLALDESTREQLTLPNFAMADYSSNPSWINYPVASSDGFHFRYDEDLISPVTEKASRALDCFIDSVRFHEQDLILEPNDVLMLNNRRCAHGRRPFSALTGENKRWLKRCLVSRF